VFTLCYLAAPDQAAFLRAVKCDINEEKYHEIINFCRDSARKGIDKALEENDVDVLMCSGEAPIFQIFGSAGRL
jgi:hypothetical protein